VSTTVTVKLALAVLPCLSVAVHLTVVVPNANVEPDAGLQVTGSVPSTGSVAVAVNVTTAPLGLVACAVMFAGTVTTGVHDPQLIVPPQPFEIVPHLAP